MRPLIRYCGPFLFLSLVGCVDDLTPGKVSGIEGNLKITLTTSGLGSRAVSDQSIKEGTDDENYINLLDGDYKFYLFDTKSKFIKVLGQSELNGSPSITQEELTDEVSIEVTTFHYLEDESYNKG